MRVLRLCVSGVALLMAAACCASPTSPTGAIGAGTLLIQVDGKNQLQVGEQSAMKATATFGSDAPQDVTSSAAWISSNGNVCTVNSLGVATGVGLGNCTVTAVLRNTSGHHPINVLLPNTPGNPNTPGDPNPPNTPPGDPNPPNPPGTTLTAVAVQGATSVVVGQTTPWKAIAIYSNGAQADVTSSSSWSSSNSSIASVSNGNVTGVSPGTANISATFAGKTATGPIVVTASGGPTVPTVTGLTVSGKTAIVTGESAQWTAIAHFSDGTSLNVTSAASWTSSTPSVASVVAGVVTGVSAGSSLISASFGGQSGSNTVNVTQAAPQLIGIEVDLGVNVLTANASGGGLRTRAATPFNVNFSLADLLNSNPILDLKVWGLYSNGTKQDVTPNATINTSDQLLTLDSSGTAAVIALLVQGLINPDHYVNVTYGGYTANANVTLNLPVLQSLGFPGSSITVGNGNQLPSLTGLFSQGINSAVNSDTPGISYAIEAAGPVTALYNVPVVGSVLQGLVNQVLNGTSVVNGVLQQTPAASTALNNVLNNALFQTLGISSPLNMKATLNGITSDPTRLNVGH